MHRPGGMHGLLNGRERSVAGDRRSRGRSRPASRARTPVLSRLWRPSAPQKSPKFMT